MAEQDTGPLLAATVIARPGDTQSRDVALKRLGAALTATASAELLGPEAGVLMVWADSPGAARAAARDAVSGLPVDVAVEAAEARRKRLFIADMDSTMIGQECIDELAAELGIREHIAAITERAMRGEIAFEPALRERVGLLRGLSAAVVDQVIAGRITLTPGARTAVQTMRAHGTYCALVSGGFTLFTGPIAAMIGFDEHTSNTLIVEGGKLAGAVAEPILGREAKRRRLEELLVAKGIDRAASLAIGDGANDLDMLAGSGLSVAFRAKPAVADAADFRLDHADLTALLYIQGYRSNDFVQG
ncbi:MAG: phosphoserine phosphatase SerB [Flavobacteriaceae bacterium]